VAVELALTGILVVVTVALAVLTWISTRTAVHV
jgi:hypothetical protein